MQLRRLLVLAASFGQLRALGKRRIQGNPQLVRDQLRRPVDLRIGHVQHTADIAHRCLRGHRTEGDDLRDMFAAVLAHHIIDHLIPPLIAEIDVDIRHRDAFGIEEALEQQIVPDRINVRDLQDIGDQAARRRPSSRSNQRCLLACAKRIKSHTIRK